MKYRVPLTILIFVIFSLFVFSGFSQNETGQENHDAHHDHHEGNHEHSHQKNEISLAVGVVPLPSENSVTAGIHLHYVRGIALKNRLGIGAAFETVIDEHTHFTISGVIQYRIYKGFILGYGPGVLILKEESNTEFHFAQHFEAVYEFELGHFHLGPLFEIGLANNDVHYMVGVHFGVDF